MDDGSHLSSPTPSPTPPAPILHDAVYRFLHTGRRAAGSGIPGAQTLRLSVPTPPGWRDGPAVDIAVHVLGSGPDVLLVHGWRGEAMDLYPLARQLAEDGHRVWLPDLPGHGVSDGAHLSVTLAASALHAVQRLSGPYHFAAGHSYGGASLVHALQQSEHQPALQARRIALLAPATDYGFFARRAVAQADVPEALWPQWLKQLAETIGVDPDTVKLRDQLQRLSLPTLVVHSSDDPIVPSHALRSATEGLPHVTWRPSEGLGHRGILTDETLLQTLHQFAVAV